MKQKMYMVLLILMVASLLLVPSSIFAAGDVASDNSVSIDEVKGAANQHVIMHSLVMPEWSDAKLSEPIPYYSFFDDTITAYEFTVLNKGESVGFIFVSARKDWYPVLGWGGSKAFSSDINEAKRVAIEHGYVSSDDSKAILSPKFYYYGAGSQSVQLCEKMKNAGVVINLNYFIVEHKPKGQEPTLQMDKKEAQAAWIKVNEIMSAKSSITPIQPKSWGQHTISGVTRFYQHTSNNCGCCDNGNQAGASWPGCVGNPNDPWYPWDGCAPISGAMVLDYWRTHGYSNISSNDEALIDHCHHYMQTSSDGGTLASLIDDGLLSTITTEYGYYNFSATNMYIGWNSIVQNVDANRPMVWNISWAGDLDHSMCGVGYEDYPWQQQVGWYDPRPTQPSSIIWWTFGDWQLSTMAYLTP